MSAERVVVAGATGFVGRQLVDRLIADGREVRCGSRDPERSRTEAPDRTWVALDVDGEGLDEAFAGCAALVYLVHSLATHGPGLADREAASAARVLAAAERTGIRRIVYLGGPKPDGKPSEHLLARLRTGEILRSGTVSTIELRASMIIGAGSESWLMCRDLALRLPVMLLPAWLATRSQPLGIDDAVAALAAAIDLPIAGSHAFGLPGPEVLSARQILERISARSGFRPLMIPVPVLTPRLSSWWLRFVTRADLGVARQLVDGLMSDLVCDEPGFWAHMPGYARVPFDEAVRRTLAAESSPDARSAQLWERSVARVASKLRSS